MIKLSIKEKKDQFLFFLTLSIVTISLLSFGLFYNAKQKYPISKIELEQKIIDNAEFENVSTGSIALIDTTFNLINQFNPNIQAVFLKRDITNSINSIKSVYERNASDSRYKLFIQNAQLYNILFFDKQEMKGNVMDTEQLKATLNDCITSRRQLQQSISRN